MIDEPDDAPELPADCDDSEPGTIPELFARPLGAPGVRGDVLKDAPASGAGASVAPGE